MRIISYRHISVCSVQRWANNSVFEYIQIIWTEYIRIPNYSVLFKNRIIFVLGKIYWCTLHSGTYTAPSDKKKLLKQSRLSESKTLSNVKGKSMDGKIGKFPGINIIEIAQNSIFQFCSTPLYHVWPLFDDFKIFSFLHLNILISSFLSKSPSKKCHHKHVLCALSLSVMNLGDDHYKLRWKIT